jgi:integrase
MTKSNATDPVMGMLDALGLTVEDLVAHVASNKTGGTNAVTLATYITAARRSLSKSTDKSYSTHFRHLINGLSRQCTCTCEHCLKVWSDTATCSCECGTCKDALAFPAMGDRVVSARNFTKTEIEPLAQIVERAAIKRAMVENVVRAKRGLAPKPTHGQGAREMCVTAMRCLFVKMVEDELIEKSPAAEISKGKRSVSKRRAISDSELAALLETVATGGDDPILDLAISWAELELGARRGGVLKVNVGHIDRTGQLISLWEKGNQFRPQPCSLELIDFLVTRASSRGDIRCTAGHPDFNPNPPVFYFSDTTPEFPHRLTGRRFDTLHKRIQLKLPWANSISYTGHALRHTIGTMVERIAGFETAKTMLGHAGGTPTDTYAKAGLPEVARAIADITGRPHPLVVDDGAE